MNNKNNTLTAIASLSSAFAWSESYIYLTNNTDQTLDLTVNQRGASLIKGDHWKQHTTYILLTVPWVI